MPLRTSCYSGLIQLTLAILTVRTLFMQARSRALADSISRPSSIPTPSGPSQTRPSSIPAGYPLQLPICSTTSATFLCRADRSIEYCGQPEPTITSSTLRSTTSSTHKPGQIIRRPTAFLKHSFNDCNSGLNTPWHACRKNRQPDTVHHGIWSR
ncbi:hypothetical protein SAMN05216404_11832 [Nitrosospira multiformis]|uniref:Uncharacterized protein n=1 Tax=Nitrosospira multiformis TaxID=1231 RepID=A0A1H8NZ92_9PROT|nr:hypothetical protein SAMN05216404_11832 [Nitrosospira multiformis]